MRRRFWRIFRLMLVLAVVVAIIAMILVARGDPTLHINMLVATGLGVAIPVLLGTSLMTLVFISADSGHDDAAAPHLHDRDE